MDKFIQTTKTIIIKESPQVKEMPLSFTKAQLETIQDISDGILHKQIDRARSKKTIEKYLEIARKKANAKNTVHLIAICLRKGLIR